MKNYILFNLFLLTTPFAMAAPTITSVSGGSFYEAAVAGSTATLYGGIAGTCAPGSISATATCSSCVNTATNPPQACNPVSVHAGLTITVSFSNSATMNGKRIELQTESGSGVDVLASATAGDVTTASLTTTWGDLCEVDDAFDPSCNPTVTADTVNFDNASRTLIIGLDDSGNNAIEDSEKVKVNVKLQWVNAGSATANAQTYRAGICQSGDVGACGFTVAPGDSKLYIKEYFITQNSSQEPITVLSEDPEWMGLAFFSQSGPSASPTTISSAGVPVVKTYDADYAIGSTSIDELENYTNSCVIMGNINKAFNIYKFATTGADPLTMCGTPSEVVGALDDKHCFISTAAFGSEMAPEVETFRQFRNQFLLSNNLGRQFVKAYYKYSPPIANFISKNENLKTATRMALFPALIFSKLALQFGFWLTGFIFLFGTLTVIQLSKYILRRPAALMVLLLITSFNIKAEIIPSQQKVQHPGASEGLTRITKDGRYVYDVQTKITDQSSHIRFGSGSFPEMSVLVPTKDANGNDIGTNELTFDDFYEGASNFAISYDYEWFPWINKGMLGLQFGVSAMYADGKGRLKVAPSGGMNPESEENYSFLLVPLNLGAVYRLQWRENQFLAPYAAGGGTYIGMIEKREDLNEVNSAGGFGFYAAGGVLLNLTAFDRTTSFELLSEYGISNLWFSLEYRMTEASTDQFELSNRNFNGGISFDF